MIEIEVEIHGFSQKRGTTIRDVVFQFLGDAGLASQAMVSVYPKELFNRRMGSQQFLRILSPKESDVAEVIRKLTAMGMNVKWQKL